MNLYCENCNRIVASDPCPNCGRGPVRAPEPGDLCFLTEQGFVQASILADILTQNGIPYMTKMRSIKGCGPIMMGNRLFYVAFDQLEIAQSVVEDLFYTHEEEESGDQLVEGLLKDDSEVFTPEEIDDLDVFMPEKMDREELTAFKKKLDASLREMKSQERLCRERINLLRDMIDEVDYLFDDLPE